jgi:hypothetical protein
VDALGLDEDAVLLSNGLEGALRLNLTADMAWQPYILGGVGWKHYNVTNTDVNTSDIRDDADALTIPVGVGLSYRYRNLVADVRGNLRPSLVEDLTASGDENDAALHTYSAHLNVGFEF